MFRQLRIVAWVGLALVLSPSLARAQTLLHQWTFNNGNANDRVGNAHGILVNGATISGGQLNLDGINDFMKTEFSSNTITNKTLITWVSLANTAQQSGSALTIQMPAGTDTFDAIDFGERTGQQWMNGSNFFGRSNPINNGGALESSTSQVMMAISYDGAGNISLYRNGAAYASQTAAGPITYTANNTNFQIGARHDDASGGSGTAAGNDPFLAGSVNEARVYSGALTVGQIAAIFAAGPATDADPTPKPLHQWTFIGDNAKDSIGTAHGTLFNGAKIVDGRLILDGVNDYMRTAPINENIASKTLVTWVSLANLSQQSGSALTLENPSGADTFDSIDFAERTGGQWMSGSDGFNRSNGANNGGTIEASLNNVMVAITYNPDGTISIYRNGSLYATYASTGPLGFTGGISDVLLGLRHEDRSGDLGTALGNDAFLAASIDEARIYGVALSAAQIQALFQQGPTKLTDLPEPGSLVIWTGLSLAIGAVTWFRRKRA